LHGRFRPDQRGTMRAAHPETEAARSMGVIAETVTHFGQSPFSRERG